MVIMLTLTEGPSSIKQVHSFTSVMMTRNQVLLSSPHYRRTYNNNINNNSNSNSNISVSSLSATDGDNINKDKEKIITTPISQSNTVTTNKKKTKKLSRPERKALERKQKLKKKNNIGSRRKEGSKPQRQYALHSTRVSSLCKSTSTADDVITAIKRAQNKHDVHDIRNIANFLLNEVDASFAYGFRGSLLARLAVAALHMSENETARKVIELRKTEHKTSILPMESAAIIRGLLRVHNVTDAISILDEELPLPPQVRLI